MTGQVALVTGSSRGIGLATAVELAREGFGVAVHGPTDDAELAAALSRVCAEGGPVAKVVFDLTDISAFEDALDAVETALGPLTTLVNNAGVGAMRRGDPLDVTGESWDRCLEVNAKGGFFLTQAFARRLLSRERSGSYCAIVTVTSVSAEAVAEERLEYAASKAAAAMATQGWAVRLGREGIAVFDVRPGLIETDMTAPVIQDYKARAAAGLTLLPRVGQPEDVGRIIATLASGRLPYATGEVIHADGGMMVPRF